MPNYQNGKIYAIKSYQTELIYIGSTVRPLSQRLGQHRSNYKKNNTGISSKELLKYSDYYIELIENFPCNSKEELEKREGYFIKQNINICVNCFIAGRTKKEWNNDNKEHLKEQHKEYYQANIEHIKEYRKNNVEQRKEYDNQYYENNKQIRKQRATEWNKNNKEKRNEKARERRAKQKQLKQQQNAIITDTQN
jgi:hypothetical protein